MMTAGKRDKPDVGYQLASPIYPGERCGQCTMWRQGPAVALGSCTAVRGCILAAAKCRLFERRSGPARRE